MAHHLSLLPAAATATRTGGQGGRSGGPERIDFVFVVSVNIIIITMIYYYGPSPPLSPARGRFVRAGRSFSQKNEMLGYNRERCCMLSPERVVRLTVLHRCAEKYTADRNWPPGSRCSLFGNYYFQRRKKNCIKGLGGRTFLGFLASLRPSVASTASAAATAIRRRCRNPSLCAAGTFY